MHNSAKLKVKGGKLIEVAVDYNGAISKVVITGDFFMHPESTLTDIEKQLIGANISDSEEEFTARISSAVEKKDVTMIGISPQDIARAVKMVVGL